MAYFVYLQFSSCSFLNLGLPLWIGGVPFSSPEYFSSVGFMGCIRNFAVDGQFLDLEAFVDQQNSVTGCTQVDSGCGLGDGGVTSSVCRGGTCNSLIGGYSCVCPAQKTGENCEKSMWWFKSCCYCFVVVVLFSWRASEASETPSIATYRKKCLGVSKSI